ncbi:MAG: leucyl/phenylalanyl-tRNA--protein transferase [Parvibaculum sp.]|uniref:leucyl/phenylalanyl-tRNA--protein transferase n=1 Tax=Parvibaculum sp. TaxID=2024848 RepID=UPI0027191F62|nr:leucyl/phenylalanyl-tRNA--protein transferase [Parvibaculum sp.]MDO8838206.1 leucyl/phenylalanyl-tRNA--protein transferase [Parvibaculum sp.]
MSDINADVLLRAYAFGVFPMAESRDDPDLYWIDPEQRGILPLDGFHVSKRLRRRVRSGVFDVRVDTAFRETMLGCADTAPGRDGTWINDRIISLYCELHARGNAHSVESWRDGKLVGGLYGVSIGAVFFGESMFSRETDASKVALVHLVARLVAGGYKLLDTQFVTEHLRQFGAIEISRDAYRARLSEATSAQADFYSLPAGASPLEFLQSTTQMS